MTWRTGLLFLLICLAGCSRGAPPPAAPTGESSAPALTTVRPQKKTVRRVVDQPAQNVEAFQQAPLHSKIAGYVSRMNVDIGDAVKANQVLVELSVPEMVLEVRQKAAALVQGEAEVKLADSSLAAAEAALKSAAAQVRQAESGRARARAELKRVESQHERLMKVGGTVLNPETLNESRFALDSAKALQDEVEAKVQSAQAARDEGRAKRDKAAADVEVARAKRDVARASRDHAEAMLEYARVKAPFDGVVTRRYVDAGHFVQPATASSKGDPLVTVDRRDKVRVSVLVPELEALWVSRQLGEKPLEGRVHGEGLGGRVLRGAVARSAFGLDARTRTLRAEIDLDNKEGLLRPGMYVYASIPLERAGVWALPSSSVQRSEGVVSCFTAEGGKARRLGLLVGLEGGGLVEVLKKQSGDGWADVTGEEEVVANPPAGMTEGQAVR